MYISNSSKITDQTKDELQWEEEDVVDTNDWCISRPPVPKRLWIEDITLETGNICSGLIVSH